VSNQLAAQCLWLIAGLRVRPSGPSGRGRGPHHANASPTLHHHLTPALARVH
jgi:hypothetical protein